MIFLEILVVVMVGFLVYKFILMPNFSTKKVDINQTPREFEELYKLLLLLSIDVLSLL